MNPGTGRILCGIVRYHVLAQVPTFLKSLFQQAEIGRSRSSVLNPLQWTLAILGGVLLLMLIFHPPEFYTKCVLFLFMACVVLILVAYLIFIRIDPDALRSEHYSLSKMAIERGLVGDSLSGLFNPASLSGQLVQTPQLIEPRESDSETSE